MTDTTSSARIEHRIGARGRFTLRQPAGDVAIRGVEGDVARVRNLEERPLGESFDILAAEGSLELRPLDRLGGLLGIWRRDSAPSLAVEVPHGASVTVEAASADVSASDLTGEKRIRTASGDVSLVRLAGGVDVGTVSGEIEIEGQVQLEVLGRTVSGDVALRLPQVRRLDLATTSGDALVDAQLSGEGPFEVRTISGDLTLVARGGLRLEVQTVTGDVGGEGIKLLESARGRKVATVGRPGPTLTFRSVSGDVAVVEAAAQPDAAEPKPEPKPETKPKPEPAAKTSDDARLGVLRALERGEISVSEAGDRLAELEEVLR
ncbi:MAG TPA: DUF4097 family beta strand repeat-containing protein [Candidatus Deferrimicrobiaceae bacterium]|nr:DUF4097 family beta strand repeat-containing protein [Candidatus Deferrimicrobiaceae bacterium]